MSQSKARENIISVNPHDHERGGDILRPINAQRPVPDAEQLARQLREQADRHLAERKSIAREIHDTFGQYLTVVELELAAIAARSDVTPGLRDQLQRLGDLTAAAHNEMSSFAKQIRPDSLADIGLYRACEKLTQEWGDRSALLFDLHVSLGGEQLSSQVENTIYHVLQEALTNIAKHANATKVGIILRTNRDGLLLVVEDDGDGISTATPAQEPSSRLGIKGMRERLDLIGGTLEIESSLGHGTTLLVKVPL
jgi:signal transduction histidine kinase